MAVKFLVQSLVFIMISYNTCTRTHYVPWFQNVVGHFCEKVSHNIWVVQISFFFSALNNDIKKNWAYYGFLSRHKDLKKIKGEEISARSFSWFSTACFLWNLCAHNQWIYGKLLISGNPQIYSHVIRKMKRYGKKKNDNRDLFAYLISIKNILIFDSPTTHQSWNDFLDVLNQYSKVVRLSKIGFLSAWKNLLKINFDQGLKQFL